MAFDCIGLGAFPSTHTAIVSSAAWLIVFKDGLNQPALAVAIGVVLVVVIDALDLRRKIERVNRILKTAADGMLGGRPETAQRLLEALDAAGIQIIEENGGGPGVRLRKAHQEGKRK